MYNAILFIDKLCELLSVISGNGYDEIILFQDFNLDIASDHLPLFILKRNLFTKKLAQQNINVKYCGVKSVTRP